MRKVLVVFLLGWGLLPSSGLWAQEPELFLIFPRVKQDENTLTGLALANPTTQPAQVSLILVDNSGNLIEGPGITNPRELTIAPNQQVAQLVHELFGPGTVQVDGWILALSDNISLVGFFLSLSPDVQQIDGAEATVLRSLPRTLVFPEIFAGGTRFTEIQILAFSDEVVPVLLEAFNEQGQRIAQKTVQIPADFGRFSGRVSEIFPGSLPEKSYIRASAPAGMLGYESFGSHRFLGGRNAIGASDTALEIPFSLFGAQLAETSAISTQITIINPTDQPADLRISAFASGGSTRTPAAQKTVKLPAGAILKENARSFLELPSGDFVGWLRVDSSITGILGDVTFGDLQGEFLSSVELQASPVNDVVFSHVADGLGVFTGLTFLNISSDAAQVKVEVFDLNGNRTGSGTFLLQPFEHRPRLLSEIIPGFQSQIAGFIRMTSDIGVFAFELFGFVPPGQSSLVSLSAVPPQRGNGTISGQITPSFQAAVAAAGKLQAARSAAARYPASRAKKINLDPQHPFVPGEMVVQLRPGEDGSRLSRLYRARGLRVQSETPAGIQLLVHEELSGLQLLQRSEPSVHELSQGKLATLDLVESLNASPHILYAEPNYLYQTTASPNDEFSTLMWHYPAIQMDRAWDITVGDSDVIVAVIDTGAKFSHPDLGPRLTGGQYDFISDPQRALDGDGPDPAAEDPGDDPKKQFSTFHGTHVAGTIGAVTNNGTGVAGVNWVSPLMTVRVLGVQGGTLFDIVQGLLWTAGLPNASGTLPAKPAQVINMSLGSFAFSQTMADAVAAVLAKNITIVAAAGNENSTQLFYPASYSGVISVGATDLSGGKAPYSNLGSRIDVVAPGGNLGADLNNDGFADGVLSTSWDESKNTALYRFEHGTSMATPHVAGLVSLMLAVNRNLTPAAIRQILQETATDVGSPGRDNIFGFGLINPVAALKAAGAAAPQSPLLSLSTGTLNFGNTLNQLVVTVSNSGGGSLLVNPPTVSTDQPGNWLTATLSGSSLTVAVNRAGLAQGNYSSRVQLTSNGGSAVVEVLMRVGGSTSRDVGEVFILAVDGRTFDVVSQTFTDVEEEYRFQLPPTFAGRYVVVAGTDDDDNGLICGDGEFCGLYPTATQPTLVPVRMAENTAGIDFVVDKTSLGAAAASPRRGFPVGTGAAKQRLLHLLKKKLHPSLPR